MHLLFSISLGTAVIIRKNEKQRLCKIGWGANKVHYGKCGSGVLTGKKTKNKNSETKIALQ